MWLNKLKHFSQSPPEGLLKILLRKVDFKKKNWNVCFINKKRFNLQLVWFEIIYVNFFLFYSNLTLTSKYFKIPFIS